MEQVSLFTLYRYAKPIDVFFIIVGILAAVGSRDEGGLKIDIRNNIKFKDVSFRYPHVSRSHCPQKI